MTGSNAENKKNIQLQTNKLMNAIVSANRFKIHILSALTLVGALSYSSVGLAQQVNNSVAVPFTVASPWTGENGREIVNLSGKVSKKNNKVRKTSHIRQTQALASPNQVEPLNVTEQEDFVPLPEYAAETLEDPEQYVDNAGTNPTLLNGYDESDVNSQELDSETVSALDNGVPSGNFGQNNQTRPATNGSENVKRYQQGKKLVATDSSPNNGTFTSAINNAPQASGNPYSKIGQAEYNPQLFYGGNYGSEGYRNTPPAAAYGQSLCDDGCCNNCGVLGNALQGLQLEVGMLGMRSPLDFEDTGNYGTEFALNWGSVRPLIYGLHAQVGARGTVTDFNGVENINGFTRDKERDQLFWTAGLYFQTPSYVDGFSGGVVFDSLDETYYRKYSLRQLRAELSYNCADLCEFGFRGAFALNEAWCEFLNMEDTGTAIEAKATASSYFALFLRKRFLEGGQFSIYGGATEWGEGLIGGMAEAPLCDSFALRASTTYVFDKNRGLTHREEETWNMMGGLVWYLGGTAKTSNVDSKRPLFEVADNGSFLQNFLR